MPPGARAAARPEAPPRQRSSSELSRAERIDLLAQIERAAKRVSESSLDLARVEGAIAAGQLAEARRLMAQVEATNPRAAGLDQLKERLAQQAAAAPPAAPSPPAAAAPVATTPAAAAPVTARAAAEPATPPPAAPSAARATAAKPQPKTADERQRVAEAEKAL